MIPEETIKALVYGFESFINKNLNDTSIIFVHYNEHIVFINYMEFYQFLCGVKVDDFQLDQLVENFINSNNSFELIKLFVQILNNIDFFRQYNKLTKFEVRFFNFKKLKRFTEINSKSENFLVTLRGIVFYRWDEIRQFCIEKRWMCNLCGNESIQVLKRGKKSKYKAKCKQCAGKSWSLIENKRYEDFFRIKIEALNEDTPNKLEIPTFTIEFTHNLCNETFLNSVLTGQAYEFTGFIKLVETTGSKGEVMYKPYMEVMSFRPIEKRLKKLEITDEEGIKITQFLPQKDSIDKLTSIFGKRVVGFQREKKYFIISKVLQECFNKNKSKVRAKDYLTHLLLVGDYATGKSEFAEACEDICEDSYYIIGSSTSGVGLTGITERDELTGHFSIQSGVLARASGDTLIIEEFDKKENKAEFGVINEAMSKYEYTITKAGKSRRFKCHTSLLIIANPEGKKFDRSVSLIPQIQIQGDLLSRFTVISCIFENQNPETQRRINEVMLNRTNPEIIKEDKYNAEYIKKCIKVASEIDPIMTGKEVNNFINAFTDQTYIISTQLIGEDKKYWENRGNARNRQSLIKLIKGVAMLHLHKTPTLEDMKEAESLFNDFQRDIVNNPHLLNPTELNTGKTLIEMEEDIKAKISGYQWEEKVEEKKETKKGKRELLIDYIKQHDEINIGNLKVDAMNKFGFGDTEFEETYEFMKREGIVYEPRAGFVRII